MAETTGKKIKQLEAATTINETDDFIIETSPTTGSPVTKRAAASVIKEMMTRELNSALGGYTIQIGRVDITPEANVPTEVHLTFPRPFSVMPSVNVTPVTSEPGTKVTGVSVSSVTKDGCDIILTRTTATKTSINWIAIGK